MHRRLELLEESGAFKARLNPKDEMNRLALQAVSYEDLEFLHAIALGQYGEDAEQRFSESEAVAWARCLAAYEAAARQLGYKSAEEVVRVSEMLPKGGSKQRRLLRI